jgi:RNA polymerase sigma-70 factor (ECF subfamily)
MVRLRLDQRLLGRIDASDVLQETFLDASRRVQEYVERPEVSLFVWLRLLAGWRLQKIHQHHLGAKLRDPRREVSLHHGAMPQATSAALAAHLVGQQTSPSERVIRAEKKILLQEALNRMDPIDREVLALRHFEGLSSAEAAEVLGIRKEAARKRYFRALNRLRTIIESLD